MRGVHRVAFCALTTFVIFVLLLWQQPAIASRYRYLTSSTGHTGYIYRGPKAEDKAVIMAKVKTDNVDWVADQLEDWQQAIYYMDTEDEGILHPPRNKGRESMAYLTFLIDHFEKLPSVMVFLHPHLDGFPQAWHTDAPNYNNVKSIRSLRLEYVLEHGYANMRCIHDPGCPAEIQINREDPDRSTEHAMREAWPALFGGNRSDIPEIIAEPCCAQFAVSRTQVLNRTKAEYVHYRQWLLDTELSDAVSGRIMEYLWHVFFGQAPQYCPDLHQCQCEQFGFCEGSE
ncbi:hypothetical protein R6Q59_010215 [Mikania micrantha]